MFEFRISQKEHSLCFKNDTEIYIHVFYLKLRNCIHVHIYKSMETTVFQTIQFLISHQNPPHFSLGVSISKLSETHRNGHMGLSRNEACQVHHSLHC